MCKENGKQEDGGNSNTLVNRKWILTNRPVGLFDAKEHAELVEDIVNLDDIPENHVVIEMEALSVDAFIRVMLDPTTAEPDEDGKEQKTKAIHGNIPIGGTIPALAIGIVRKCPSGKFAEGTRVNGLLGAQTVGVLPEDGLVPVMSIPYVKPSSSLNWLGLTGLTAYVGIHYVLDAPKKGETVLVSAAAGATGNIAAQLAKATGARVIGIAGGPDKQKFLMETLKLDGAVDYKHPEKSVEQQLDELCPDGIDFFFDNVGGSLLDMVLERINLHSRVVICGAISQYSDVNHGKVQGPSKYLRLAERSSKMAGFVVLHYASKFPWIVAQLLWYFWRGQLNVHEQIEDGIETFGPALQKLFTGGNTGRLIVDISGALK
jgi:NADPH-dependent curcumin reductase CurA